MAVTRGWEPPFALIKFANDAVPVILENSYPPPGEERDWRPATDDEYDRYYRFYTTPCPACGIEPGDNDVCPVNSDGQHTAPGHTPDLDEDQDEDDREPPFVDDYGRQGTPLDEGDLHD